MLLINSRPKCCEFCSPRRSRKNTTPHPTHRTAPQKQKTESRKQTAFYSWSPCLENRPFSGGGGGGGGGGDGCTLHFSHGAPVWKIVHSPAAAAAAAAVVTVVHCIFLMEPLSGKIVHSPAAAAAAAAAAAVAGVRGIFLMEPLSGKSFTLRRRRRRR